MEAFALLKNTTLCPFAQSARVEHGPPWSRDLTFIQNVAEIAEALRRHLPKCRREKMQGFVAQIGVDAPLTFEVAVATFRRFVFELANHDRSCRTALNEEIGAEDWNFVFNGEPIFLNFFAVCYPNPHSKKVDDLKNIYVFFQPEFTFEFCNVNRNRTGLKDQIRRKFADAGMPYDGNTIDSRRKALSYVFPRDPNSPPVEWWTFPEPPSLFQEGRQESDHELGHLTTVASGIAGVNHMRGWCSARAS